MSAESENQKFKKLFLDEVPNMICPETPPLLWAFLKFNPEGLIDAILEESKNMDFSKMYAPEFASYLDDNHVYDPALSRDENFRNGVRALKEFWRLKKSSTKAPWNNIGKSLNRIGELYKKNMMPCLK